MKWNGAAENINRITVQALNKKLADLDTQIADFKQQIASTNIVRSDERPSLTASSLVITVEKTDEALRKKELEDVAK